MNSRAYQMHIRVGCATRDTIEVLTVNGGRIHSILALLRVYPHTYHSLSFWLLILFDLHYLHNRLYPSCEWEPKAIRRLVGDGKLAARLKGADSRITKTDRECPICFMYYSENNVTKCCRATICTECYLQIKPQKDKHTTCPFCNNPKMIIIVQKGMDEGDIAKREEEEQRVIEATIRNRAAQMNVEVPASPSGDPTTSLNTDGDGASSIRSSFGSSLADYNRSRTFSNSESTVSAGSGDQGGAPTTPTRTGNDNDDAILSLAMSPEARRELEREMRAQLSHATHQRMESEAEEARLRHVQEWSRTDSGVRNRMREERLQELTALLERMSANDEGGGDDSTGEDRTVTDAARARGNAQTLGDLLRALETYGSEGQGRGRGRGGLDDLMRLEAAFILGMDDDYRRLRASGRSSARINDGAPFSIPLGGGRRVIARGLPRRAGGSSTHHMETAEMLMRGVSEEEQLAMAIEMSMRDAEEQAARQQQEGEGGTVAETVEEEGEDVHTESSASDDQATEDGEEGSLFGSSEGDSGDDEPNNPGVGTVGRVSLDEDEEEVVFETG